MRVDSCIKEIKRVLNEEGSNQPVIGLSGFIKGKERLIFFLGETHLATKKEQRAAEIIISKFKFIGCEGVDVSKSVEGKIFFWIMGNIISPIIGILIYFGVRSGRNKSSLRQAYEIVDSKINDSEIILLEKGWKPSIRNRIFFIALPVWFFKVTFEILNSICLNIIDNSDIVIIENPLSSLIRFYIFLFLFLLIDKIPILKNVYRFLVEFVFNYVFDLTYSRNINMARNLISELSLNDKMDSVLVLTGSAHTSQIAKILVKKYGFIEKNSKI